MKGGRFRITTWPAIPLPHPAYVHPERATIAEGRFVLKEPPPDPAPDPVASAGEIYLELGKLDLGQERSILRFVERFGILDVRRNQFAEFQHVPGFKEKVLPRFRRSWPEWVRRDYREARKGRHSMKHGEMVEEFRFGARLLLDLTSAWRCLNEGRAPREFEWRSTWWNPRWRDQAATADLLTRVLGDGLEVFHPAVEVFARRIADEPREFSWRRPVSLYSVCCLELFNHIVEGATYRWCANDRCGRLFVRQAGGARHGQHRLSGIMYCSSGCARAVANRMYRRRLSGGEPTTAARSGERRRT